ncbi:MAG: hypothetical protein AB1486_13665 [Planctomycetota bacterium]
MRKPRFLPWVVVVACASLRALGARANAQETAQLAAIREILAQAEAASGARVLAPNAVVYEEWQFLLSDRCGVALVWFSADGFRVEQVISDKVLVEGASKQEYYHVDVNGRVTVRELSTALNACGSVHRMRFDYLNPERYGAEVSLAPKWTTAGRDYPGVRFHFPDSLPFTFYFDPDTHMPARLEAEREDGNPVIKEYSQELARRTRRLACGGPDRASEWCWAQGTFRGRSRSGVWC